MANNNKFQIPLILKSEKEAADVDLIGSDNCSRNSLMIIDSKLKPSKKQE